MALSGALSIAGSGLRTTSSWAELTSRNIANATTDGYVRKDVHLGTNSGAVEITAIRRETNASLERLDRSEASKLSRLSTISDALEVYTASLGQPDDEMSPAVQLTRLQESLNALANKPGEAAMQSAVLDTANRLTSSLNDAASLLDGVAAEVELSIRYDVADVNDLTRRLAELNDRIIRTEPGSVAHAEMRDEMGRIVDQAAQYLDVLSRESVDGRIDLYTTGGTALVEGDRASVLRYDAATGALTAGAEEITPAKVGIRGFEQGSLAGLFELKNDILPTYQLQLDEMARTLVQEFEAADASLAPGQAGLFTDAGAAYTAGATTGLAKRITVNAAMDPSQGGALSRFRDGAGAVTTGSAGDSTQIHAFIDIFNQSYAFDPAALVGDTMTLEGYTTAMVAKQNTIRTDAVAERDSVALSAEAFSAARMNYAGVNTDDELQKLMLIEQSYAANAKMMTTVSAMMDALLAAV